MKNTSTFPDVPADHPARTEIEMMTACGMILPRADGTFRPDEPLTRAEAAEIAFRILSHFHMLK